MNKLDTTYIKRCNEALDRAFTCLKKYDEEDIEFDIYRSAVIKEFEIILEQSGKLLKKVLKPYMHTNKAVDKLVFKDIFRQAGLHGLLNVDEVKRWLEYRDNRNSTSHDYGEFLANETLVLIPQFIKDVKKIIEVIDAS
ncbi:MAG: HI0074 family nucleotidyltransferase substrate-binding subunit [Campylobacterota bacterium]|nr:HI0074 family nucleotidyltransferase substrate-binding subunit [Campylobacterota bacterium]